MTGNHFDQNITARADMADRFAATLDCADIGFLLDELPESVRAGDSRTAGAGLNKPWVQAALSAALALARTRRYGVPPASARTIAALLALRDHVIAPILAGIRSLCMGGSPRSGPTSTATMRGSASACRPLPARRHRGAASSRIGVDEMKASA